MDGLWSCRCWNPCNKQQSFYSHLYSTGVMVGCWKEFELNIPMSWQKKKKKNLKMMPYCFDTERKPNSRATKLDQKKTWRQAELGAFQSADNNMPNINQGMAKVSQCFIMYNSTCASLFGSYLKEISGVCTLTQQQFKLLVKAAQVKSLNNESNDHVMWKVLPLATNLQRENYPTLLLHSLYMELLTTSLHWFIPNRGCPLFKQKRL